MGAERTGDAHMTGSDVRAQRAGSTPYARRNDPVRAKGTRLPALGPPPPEFY
jgi:hypothetical protein